ncbi:enoyl-CoA hydratase/isomerase family protein [Hymenobacter pini]|uniref:enoyl-CoA hydratase/isomerase family protein n=1 Tax=Hymenobacter pini TaxID=2880879 RepID=UPI001CF3BA4B|nr:enoyl-CoA hydratase-related protein [Hymenobacter pini]MCA8829565.1 enoyl-CoA hydratase/isomerase family protein [Hymenobacter pini]
MTIFHNIVTDLNERGIFTLTINRPSKYNALNHQTLDELEAAFVYAIGEPQVKAILVTGAGEKAFVAGADIAEIQQLSAESSLPFVLRGQQVCHLIENCPKPVVAAVNGFALGGGTELAMACHIRVASETARFGLPEVSLGIMPGYGGTQRLPALIGKGRAFEYIFTGKQIPAAEAYRIGLVNQVVAPDELVPSCHALLESILTNSLSAISQVVKAVNAHFTNPKTGYQVEVESFQRCCEAPDFQEGTRAFVEKRRPTFQANAIQ